MERLLIVEEALRDLKAHWFEYIKTIDEGARAAGWTVDVACHQAACLSIQQAFSSFPVFRYARYLDNQTNRLPGDRYYGFILHSLRQVKVLWPLLNQQAQYDLAFAPTVMMHHLLAWWLIMTFHPNKPKRLTLFFVTNPGIWNTQSQTATLPKSSALMGRLLKLFRRQVEQDKVTLAVETKGAQQEFGTLTQLPFTLMPHPVPNSVIASDLQRLIEPLNFACYGFARYEKGSDLLKAAIAQVLAERTDFPTKFSVQWVEAFSLPDGSLCQIDDLKEYAKVTIIDKPVMPAAYQQLLAKTSCMILPYRNSSYYARVSRVAIEAAYQGIPVIYTRGGWLEDTITEYGAGIGIADQSVEELVRAIEEMAMNYSRYQQEAIANAAKAKRYFSAKSFCNQLLC